MTNGFAPGAPGGNPLTPPTPPVQPEPPVAPMPPLDDASMVTLPPTPGQPQAPEDRMLEIKYRGEMVQKPESEVIALAQQGFDYNTKMQELAPAKEMLDFVQNTPGAADAIVALMEQGVPQAQAQQAVQQQAQPGYPQQQQQMDPAVNFLLNQVASVQSQMERQQFMGTHPQADFDSVVQHMVDREIPSLELAYRDMTYDDVAKAAGQNQQQQYAQRQQNSVEPGAQGPPRQDRIDPRKITPDQMPSVRDRYNLIE
jgi:hypothetical protein